MSLRKFWKAHKWYIWLFYYSLPVLKGVLPEPLLKHWSKLVKGVSLLLGENITRDQITESEALLTDFVKDISMYTMGKPICLIMSIFASIYQEVQLTGGLCGLTLPFYLSLIMLLDMIKSNFTVVLNDEDQNFFSIKRFLICQNENEERCAIGRFYEQAKHSLCASNPQNILDILQLFLLQLSNATV